MEEVFIVSAVESDPGANLNMYILICINVQWDWISADLLGKNQKVESKERRKDEDELEKLWHCYGVHFLLLLLLFV